MSLSPNGASQLAPSQFAYLKTIEPQTTTSVSQYACLSRRLLISLLQGITPGRALLDPPSRDRSPPVLQRSQRVRKPSARKAEACESFLCFNMSYLNLNKLTHLQHNCNLVHRNLKGNNPPNPFLANQAVRTSGMRSARARQVSNLVSNPRYILQYLPQPYYRIN